MRTPRQPLAIPRTNVCLLRCALQSGRSDFVKSFGRREAYESPRGTNPPCAARGLWGFEDLAVSWVMGVVFTRLLAIAVLEVLSGDRGADPRPRMGKAGDGV